jgi:ABC-2 type transport system permease protein
MACVTSYFNSTLWHKSMHRFWPLWTVYLVGWLFLIPFLTLQQYFSYLSWVSDAELPIRLLRLALNAPEMLQPGVWLAAGYGLLCAMAVFGYLYNHRSAAMMHALPMRRETLFATQYLAGLSFLLLPLLAVGLITMVGAITRLPPGVGVRPWAMSSPGCWARAAFPCFSTPSPPSAPCSPATFWPCPPSMAS